MDEQTVMTAVVQMVGVRGLQLVGGRDMLLVDV